MLKGDIQMMRRNIDLEARLIDDLLDLTRITKGKLSLNIEPANLHDLLTSVVGIVRADGRGAHAHQDQARPAQRASLRCRRHGAAAAGDVEFAEECHQIHRQKAARSKSKPAMSPTAASRFA